MTQWKWPCAVITGVLMLCMPNPVTAQEWFESIDIYGMIQVSGEILNDEQLVRYQAFQAANEILRGGGGRSGRGGPHSRRGRG